MKNERVIKKVKTLEAVTHTHTHTHTSILQKRNN